MAMQVRFGSDARIVFFVLIIRAATAGFAQQPEDVSLPRGFSDVRLGMNLSDVKTALERDMNFDYRGDPDVSLTPSSLQPVIETAGFRFIDRGFFQFHDDSLYIITLRLNAAQIDHYTMFQRLSDQYGPPSDITPQRITWQDEEVRLVLEKPVVVKYIDRTVFEQLKEEAGREQAFSTLSRSIFLDQF
ncbi:MAG: hypothetical protein EA426_07895 [Spirochaetaceae bacterium]|nr:MAG: hypothetical protein EA426_07895 [Spirochaetaceae bacterium]